MKVTLSSTKCGLLAIYFILLGKGELMDKIGTPIALSISLVFATLCLLIPFDTDREEDE